MSVPTATEFFTRPNNYNDGRVGSREELDPTYELGAYPARNSTPFKLREISPMSGREQTDFAICVLDTTEPGGIALFWLG
jgi:hypothetical protein